MSMNWNRLTPTVCDGNMPAPMLAEGRRLNEAIADVADLRASADEAGELTATLRRADPTADRSPYYTAILAALRAELAIYEPLEIFYAATEEWRGRAAREAERAIFDVGETIRKRLGIHSDIAVPICCLQNDPAWWAARKTADLFPVLDKMYGPEVELRQEAPLRVQEEIRSYEGALEAEGRLIQRKSEAASERDRLAREREQVEAGQRDESTEWQKRIDSLLTEPERSKGRRRAPPSEGGAE